MTKPLDLKHIPLSDLHISLLNMRHMPKGKNGTSNAPDLDDIMPSIEMRGIRRYLCLQTIVSKGGEIGGVPVCIMDAHDDTEAVEASIIENIARLAPTEMEQYIAFDRLAKKGESIAGIAAVFGITERAVKQRLALGQLIPILQRAYTDEKIDVNTIRALTMATKKQQKDWHDLFSTDEYTPTGNHLSTTDYRR